MMLTTFSHSSTSPTHSPCFLTTITTSSSLCFAPPPYLCSKNCQPFSNHTVWISECKLPSTAVNRSGYLHVGGPIALHEATEAYFVSWFEDSFLCHIHAGWLTLHLCEVQLVQRLCREIDFFHDPRTYPSLRKGGQKVPTLPI